jgi:protein phosphatase
MKITATTDIGTKRKTNQDSFYIFPDNVGVIVADGMGGHAGGEIAATAAVTAVRAHLEKAESIDENQIAEMLKKAIVFANDIIFEMNDGGPSGSDYKSMGTTIVMIYFCGNKAFIASVGDSRCYFIKDHRTKMKQITTDHNVVNSLMEIGKITSEQAAVHPQRNVLTRALGTDRFVEVDVKEIEIQKGAYILLCTDGLTNAISEFEIEQLVKSGYTPQDLCTLANRRSGEDNVTVAIIAV